MGQGRRPPPAVAVDEEELRRRWAALDLDQRRQVVSFDDAGLVGRIREAVQTLYQDQVRMWRLGMRAEGAAEPDLLVDSPLLRDAIDLQWKVEKSDDFPDAVIMDPDRQPTVMSLQAPMLEGDHIFSRFQATLPDFLAPKTGRRPFPRARWKQPWATAPSSVASLEEQLAKLVEQALWCMGLKPAFATPSSGGAACGDFLDAALLEELEGKSPDADSRQGTSKSKKKKKKKPGPEAEGRGRGAIAEGACLEELNSAGDEEACLEEARSAGGESPVAAEQPGSRAASAETPEWPAGREAQGGEGDEHAAELPGAPAPGAAPGARGDPPPAAAPDARGTPISEQISALKQQIKRATDDGAYDRVGSLVQQIKTLEAHATEEAVLQLHYWGGARPRAWSLRWCLPATPWPRGRWLPCTEQEADASPAAKHIAASPRRVQKAVVHNTFIDVVYEESSPPVGYMSD